MSDKIPESALADIARTGRCYTNEARAMAQEIIECRQHQAAVMTDFVVPRPGGITYTFRTYKP